MKIAYVLKKGIQYYPPCLAQILYLNDLGADLVVYHGNNSEYVTKILEDRNIEHHKMECDIDSKNRFESILNFYKYIKTVNKLVKKFPRDYFIWFGNCESAIAVKKKNLYNRRYILSVLELYDKGTIYDKGLKKIIYNAEAVICCEKHRAAIMRCYYEKVNVPIYVIPNKPYDNGENVPNIETLPTDIIHKIEKIKNSKVVLYQGIVTRDRPLEKIAQALNLINSKNYIFVVMGKASDSIQKELVSLYENTLFMGYVPSPQHLCVTQFASVGIANYDYSCLNNLFCAPNKIYEYAEFGIPMLASLNIGLTETVGECGAAECVDFSSVEDIAIGLKKLLNNTDEYSKNARAFYEKTNNKEVVAKILTYINQKV